MTLKEIIKDLNIFKISGDTGIDIKGISADSREIKEGSLFVAIKGLEHDGHEHVIEAVKKGAVALLTSSPVKNIKSGITQVSVDNTRKAIPIIARNFFGNPSSKLKLVGITGTNGKTTTAYLLRSMLMSAGLKVSMVTTVESFIGADKVDFSRTTPESIELNDFFRRSVESGIDISVMEVSSHAIDRHRVDHLEFDCFAYTNLSQDHLDYHKTMDEYYRVKSRLFDPAYRQIYKGRSAVINTDDYYGNKLISITDLDTLSYSLKDSDADIHAYDITNKIEGISTKVNLPDGVTIRLESPMSGFFNIYNILASIGLALKLEVPAKSIIEGVKRMRGAKGRFEKVEGVDGFDVVIDYAHTPDGLEKVLQNARSLLGPGARLISVFGCGGDRDRAKRPEMGRISSILADHTIITSDNPRSEDPLSIINMIEKGFADKKRGKYSIEPDRKKAIIDALETAGKGDLVIIAGKGHEDYQEFAHKKIHFSDEEIVKGWLGD